jgi:hypothetical protein
MQITGNKNAQDLRYNHYAVAKIKKAQVFVCPMFKGHQSHEMF